MATINDYTTGKILENVKLTVKILKFVKIPILGPFLENKLLSKIQSFKPKIINLTQASDLILNSDKCAIGERVCRTIYTDSDLTESVFLNDLALGMVKYGKAKFVDKDTAITTLEKYPKNPLILSKVSNHYSEICRSLPENCVFFNMEKQELKIF